jgi:hypothetical protein
MNQTGFDKVGDSDRSLYGPRKLLLAGFNTPAPDKFEMFLAMLRIADLPLVWIATEMAELSLGELLNAPHDSGRNKPSALPRTIVVAGITEQELHHLMAGCRQAGMKDALWAVVTPTSERWPFKELLTHLIAEREALRKERPSVGAKRSVE